MENAVFVRAVERFEFNGKKGMNALATVVNTILEGDASTAGASYSLDHAHDGLAAFLALLPSD